MLGLAYPGGPEIEKYAKNGDSTKYSFTIPRIKKNPLNFSFSGIKTALYYKIKEFGTTQMQRSLSDICASYQDGILNILFDRLEKISKIETENDIRHISIAELIRTSIEIYCDAYEEDKDGKS